ncbi:GLPGLI family protein [Myroides guanonis]|uniref:GLPGLI family protein n=1 Tax=Myroides guanonis TaxID=1150112 RepID=A0A1I3NAA9_9FLAO|nr:GLPGLI family protein [Myroides guanonis]SFJ06271.1 GLPGLI family protein [Myroides guanonis]
MIKKALCLLTVALFTVTSFAQDSKEVMRYTYQATFKPFDKKEGVTQTPIVEELYLDVLENTSRCMPATTLAMIEAEISDEEDDVSESQFTWLAVIRENKQLTTLERLNSLQLFAVQQGYLVEGWEISRELEDYNGLQVQKATSKIGGRQWTAWFTKEIPLIDGPYKFKNLPGFVVKVMDSEEDYVFEFLNSAKITTFWFTDIPNAEKINEKEFKQIKKANTNKNMLQVIAEQGSHWANETEDPNVREQMTKKFGKEPNPIELE